MSSNSNAYEAENANTETTVRPTQSKPKGHCEEQLPIGEVSDDNDAVGDSQAGFSKTPGDYEPQEEDGPNTKAQDKDASIVKPATSKQSSTESKDKEGAVKKGARKLSSYAQANFRKLKIKNKNSKAKGNGRFGRRRG